MYEDGAPSSRTVVAREVEDRSDTEIELEATNPLEIYSVDVHGEWASWRRRAPEAEHLELVLHNIMTGEQRVLDVGREGVVVYGGRLWGDRVVWSTSQGALKEHRISTGVTREVLREPRLAPMYYVSVWDHYAAFNHESYSAPWTVYLVDLDTAEVRPISPADSRQDQPHLHGGRVVWTDFRGGGGPGGGMHVYVYSIATGREYLLNPSAPGGSEPRIFDRTVLWQGRAAPDLHGGIWVTRIGDV